MTSQRYAAYVTSREHAAAVSETCVPVRDPASGPQEERQNGERDGRQKQCAQRPLAGRPATRSGVDNTTDYSNIAPTGNANSD